jgi:hypothetical protein
MRFRSPIRDLKTDETWHQEVRSKLNDTLSQIERERVGVASRLERARDQASGIVGTEDGIYFERETEVEQMLCDAERQMALAIARLSSLAAQREKYRKLLQLLDSFDTASPSVLG